MSRYAALASIAVGVALTMGANVMYYRRTADPNKSRFWLPRSLLSPREFWLNRVGFVLAVVGFVLAFVIRFSR